MTAELRRALTRRELAATAHRAAARKRMVPSLDESGMLVVAHLAEQGGLRPAELGRRLALSSGGITAVVQRLEADCWLKREPHPSDGRSVIVSLTPRAREQGARLYAPLALALDQLADELPPEHRAAVVEFLNRAAAITAIHAERLCERPPRAPGPAIAPALWS